MTGPARTPLEDWRVAKADLEVGETRRATWIANYTNSRFSTVGGTLELTDRRLVFRPGRVDRALGSRVWSVPVEAISELGRVARTWNPCNGGLRARLRVTTRDGAAFLFVVNRLERVIAAIAAARAGAAPPG